MFMLLLDGAKWSVCVRVCVFFAAASLLTVILQSRDSKTIWVKIHLYRKPRKYVYFGKKSRELFVIVQIKPYLCIS